MSGNSQECPYESGRVECARCEMPYNVDEGVRPLANESAMAMLYLASKVSYYVIGGLCDACGYVIGQVTKK